MSDNRLSPHVAAIGPILEKSLPPGVGYALVLFDLKNNDMAVHSNAQRWQWPLILRAAADGIVVLDGESPLAMPGTKDIEALKNPEAFKDPDFFRRR